MCPWASGFLKTGKAEKPSASETCDCKASNSESLCHEGEWVGSKFLQLRVCGKNLLLLFRKVLLVLMSKCVLGESLPESLCSSKGETLGFVPAGRGGALGATGAGLVGKFWNILCCSNSKLPSSGNQGLHSTTVWRQASVRWRETESPWTLNKWWSKVAKWWGFPAI